MRKHFKSIGAIALALAMVASLIPANVGKAAYSYQDDYSIGWNGGVAV